jgi:hypothetical protein
MAAQLKRGRYGTESWSAPGPTARSSKKDRYSRARSLGVVKTQSGGPSRMHLPAGEGAIPKLSQSTKVLFRKIQALETGAQGKQLGPTDLNNDSLP